MDEEALDRIRVLIEKFHQDRKVEGYSEKSRGQTTWALWYLLDFLKGRDEADVTAITSDTMHKFQMDLYNRRGKEKAALSLVSQ